MKLRNIVYLFCLFLLPLSGYTQRDWNRFITENPRTALQEAEKMYAKAQTTGNNPALIQALILKIRSQILIDKSTFPAAIAELEQTLLQTSDSNAKSILHSIAAQLYEEYYSGNAYRIHSRTSLENEIPEDLNEWSPNLFVEKIFFHALAALQPSASLQQTPVGTYRLILTAGSDSPLLRPTLYDFLCYRSISQLNLLSAYPFSTTLQPSKADTAIALAPLDRFLQSDLQAKPFDGPGHILQIYQNLLRFRQSDTSDRAALLISDLDRLDYAREITENHPAYFSRLQQLSEKYAGLPYVVEVLYREAGYYLETANLSPGESEEREKALQIVRKGIQKYPHYKRIGLLKQIAENIERPRLDINFKDNVYPGQQLNLQMSYYHLKKIELSIYRIHETTTGYKQKLKDSLPCNKTRLLQKTITFTPRLALQDSSFRFTIPASGLYEIRIISQRGESVKRSFICSRLFTSLLKNDNKTNFLIRDAQSGKPVTNARVTIYNRSNTALTSVTTNAMGLATYTGKAKHFMYEVTDKQNPNGQLVSQYNYPYSSPSEQNSTALFTDRQVYRPGQTVHYCGISWLTNTDTAHINKGKKYTLTLYDANQQLIGKQEKTTNEWGTFSGSFVLPRETLNGEFSLRTEEARNNFSVADYKRPTLEITLCKQAHIYRFGDTILTEGHIKTYSGISLPHTRVSYRISLHSFYRWEMPETTVLQGETTTDTDGNFHFSFHSEAPQTTSRGIFRGYYYEIQVEATDSKGETQQLTSILPIGNKAFRTEILLTEQVDKSTPVPLRIRTFNLENQPVSENIFYKISKLSPLKSLGETYNPDSLPIEKNILTGQLRTSTDSVILHFNNWPSGAYLVQAYIREKGEETELEKRIFYLYALSDKRPPVLTYNWVVPLKTVCAPGESAEILLGTSARDVYVFYEIYSEKGVEEQKLLTLSDEVSRLVIPYKASYGHTISLLLSYVKDGKFFSNEILIRKQQADRHLTFVTEVFRNKLLPGQQEEWTFTIKDAEGQPVKSEVMAVMYDRSLDRLRPNVWNFAPQPYLLKGYPQWREAENLNMQFIGFDFYRRMPPVPPFRFDRLNLYGLSLSPRLYNLLRSTAKTAFDSGTGGLSENVVETAEEMAPRPAMPLQTPELRKDFAETAFFYPQLLTNEKGELVLHFTVPEAVTGWKFMALAHTAGLAYGYIEKDITTLKYLTVNPNLPRFFRSGDSSIINATLSNQSSTLQEGIATLELFNAGDNRIILSRSARFSISAGQNTTVDFGFEVPQNLSVIGCRITAKTATFSDGEQHLIAVAPDKILLTETLPIFTAQSGSHTYSFPAVSQDHQDYRLTLELTANPIWYAVLALPALQQADSKNITGLSAAYYVNAMASSIARSNPRITEAIRQWKTDASTTLLSQIEQNQELKSIALQLTPWITDAQNETEQMQSLQQLFDLNSLRYRQEELIRKIREQQHSDGGWGWFKDMSSSRFMTANVLTILARVNVLGQYETGEQIKTAQIRGLRYLDLEAEKEYSKRNKEEKISYEQILYLYTRSFYRDIPIGSTLEAHKYYMAMAEEQWPTLSLYEKALITTTFFRYGKTDMAHRILRSLKEYATISPESGMYWANNTSSSFAVNSALIVHVALMEAFFETDGHTTDTDLMKQWLLRQKQIQSWGNVPATVDAIYALLLTGNPLLDQTEHLTVAVGPYHFQTGNTDQFLGYLKTGFPATQITPEMKTVVLNKNSNTPTYGGVYLQYFEKLSRVTAHQNKMLDIEKKLFIERRSGKKVQLHPINSPLHPGDKVIIRLTVRADRDFQYVHLQDLRAACFEPVEQLSGLRWKQSLPYYEDMKDVSTHYFFDYLPKGTYVFEYPVWANQSGIFQDGIATIQCLYAPQFTSYSEAGKIEIDR